MERLNAEHPIHNECTAVRLTGQLDAQALEQAINSLVERYETLRTTIQATCEQPVAIVHESWPVQFKQIDLSHLPSDERQIEFEQLLVHEPRQPFHLEASPGIRATLVRLGPQDHVFFLMIHHMICDPSSEAVLWRELSASYRLLLRGEPLNLPPPAVQQGDYAAWQQKQMVEEGFGDDLAFWEENLRGAPGLLELPTDRPRPAAMSHGGKRQHFKIGSTLAQALRDRSREEKTSLFALMIAALDVLLYRYTASDDIIVGLPANDRDRAELQSAVGFLVHLHALRTRLSGATTFRELLHRIQNGMADLYSHHSSPFDQVVNRVRPERNLSYPPLVQVIASWRDRHEQVPFTGFEGLKVESLWVDTGTSNFDLALSLDDNGDEIALEVKYNTDIFDDARILRMFGHYQTLLTAVAKNSDQRIAALPLLTGSEREQLLVDWNRTASDYAKDRCVHQLVEEHAENTPEAVAVSCSGAQLTYRQLNDRANQLAHHLRKLGVEPDTLVGICAERSLEMLVGLLGILKAGGAYLPMDPGYPKERLAFMLQDSGAPVLLTQQGLRDQLEIQNCHTLCLDSDWEAIAQSPTDNPTFSAGAENLAYVIYTSGSTGEPKGVELTHGGLLNLVCWHRQTYQVKPTDRATQLAGVGFDAAVWEVWPYLTAGASLDLPDEETRLLPEKLRDWLVQREITLSFVPTPLAEALVALPWPAKVSLRAMLTGGDRLTCHVPPTLPFSLVNHYGPTESTVVTTCAAVEVDRQDGHTPPIGKPIANIQVYLLDDHLQPVPIGVPGELHIGGDGLARGYHRRPQLTAEKFIADPFSGKPGARLYKTGDLARYLASGAIEFLRRNDDQVKIRGFRIELGEIEAVLTAHPGVGAAVVVANGDGTGEKRLIAYATIHAPEPTVGELREHLKKQLPDYMVPAAFVILEEFPLTSNGKVDRAALPSANTDTLADEVGAAPATEIEKTIAGIVATLLGLDRVDMAANFFDLGGHSLMATQLIARVRDEYGLNLPLLKVFESPTVFDLSADIEEMLVAEVEAMSEEEIQRSLAPISETQKDEARK